jgi:Copper transport outer membrane protein, MctB
VIRRLLVWLVVIVTALAAGIALGGGPLSDVGSTPSEAAPAPTETTDPRVAARADFADRFASTLAPQLYADRLQGQSVAVLTMPGADPEAVEQLIAEVAAAGGEVTGTFALKRALVDAGEKTLVDTLGTQVVEQLGDDVVTPEATTYDRMGQLIGRAVSARSEKKALAGAKVSSLRASLDGARLVTLPEGDPGLASLVLVVAGDEVEQPVIEGLVTGLAAASVGIVVAGPTDDPGVAALRDETLSRPVTTVDGIDTPAGRVTTMLALVRSLDEPGGSYGASGSDGPAPLG